MGIQAPARTWLRFLTASACLTIAACATLNSDTLQHPSMISFYLRAVCLPHLREGGTVEETARKNGLHRETSIDIQEQIVRYCSADRHLGCVSLEADYCGLILTQDRDFTALDRRVEAVLAADREHWTSVPPLPRGGGDAHAYCNAADSIAVDTFGVAPGETPASIERFVHRPEYDLTVSRRSEPAWCSRRRRDTGASSSEP
jgi:hypothetical protein